MIQIVNTHHTYGQGYPSIGGLGGYVTMPETTRVEWSDGTQLVVEDQDARAIYQGITYRLNRIHTSLHDGIVEHWIERISIRLQKDVPASTRLADRVRNWNSDTSRAA